MCIFSSKPPPHQLMQEEGLELEAQNALPFPRTSDHLTRESFSTKSTFCSNPHSTIGQLIGGWRNLKSIDRLSSPNFFYQLAQRCAKRFPSNHQMAAEILQCSVMWSLAVFFVCV
ncbi:UNVERIFIED_CONTAM: hypothetical protein K2H54_062594 [Gekko kuhli]